MFPLLGSSPGEGIGYPLQYSWALLVAQMVKKSACNVGAQGLIPGIERAPGRGHGTPRQCSCLENPMDRGAWRATVHGCQRVGHDPATKRIYLECFGEKINQFPTSVCLYKRW